VPPGLSKFKIYNMGDDDREEFMDILERSLEHASARELEAPYIFHACQSLPRLMVKFKSLVAMVRCTFYKLCSTLGLPYGALDCSCTASTTFAFARTTTVHFGINYAKGHA
jgi:hypothetical protein